jgi:hypothetical protein
MASEGELSWFRRSLSKFRKEIVDQRCPQLRVVTRFNVFLSVRSDSGLDRNRLAD